MEEAAAHHRRIAAHALAVASLALLALGGCERAKETGPEEEVAATAPPTATPVAPATADPAAAKPLDSFAGKDVNADGRITSVEHATAAQTMFRMMDADGNGSVTVAEMDAARAAIGSADALSSEKKIATIDSDRDGKLTLAEHVAGSNALFSAMDADKNDALDQAEWDAGHAVPASAGATTTK